MATEITTPALEVERTLLGMKPGTFFVIIGLAVTLSFSAGASMLSLQSDVAECRINTVKVSTEVALLKTELAGYRQRDVEFAVVKEQMSRVQVDVAEMKTMLKELTYARR